MTRLRSTLPGAGNAVVVIAPKAHRRKARTAGAGFATALPFMKNVSPEMLIEAAERLQRTKPVYRPLAGEGFKLGGRGFKLGGRGMMYPRF